MRIIAIIIVAFIVAGAAGAVEHRHPYRRQYVHDTFGKRGLAGVGARAGLAHARNGPKQWGRGGAGFGKRLASGAATHVIKNSIQYPVAGLRHEDLKYHRSPNRHFGPRLKHALVSTVVTRKTTNGRKTVAAGRISGAMGSGAIASTWAPAAAGGAATGGISLGTTAATNVAREFWPRKKYHAARSVRH